jgi:hypothetical protein
MDTARNLGGHCMRWDNRRLVGVLSPRSHSLVNLSSRNLIILREGVFGGGVNGHGRRKGSFFKVEMLLNHRVK